MYEQRSYIKYGNGVETNYGYSANRRRLASLDVVSPKYEGKIMDYAYTLQGWMKGMNSDELGKDMGGDGNDKVSRDVVGFTLGYNNNDYRPIAKGQTADFYRAVSEQNMTDLYTGNISRMATALANPELGGGFGTQVRDFRYDVLNRLKSSKVQGTNAYATAYTYDANGNITGLTRNNAKGEQFDNLAYKYEQDAAGNFINNRLLHVNDGNKDVAGTDIKDQGEYAQNDPSKRNYAYDQQGNLISDKSEEIANIEWTATGKVRRITCTPQSGKPDLEFRYDASGNRVSKTVIAKPSGERTTTYYVRDAQGTTLATYTEKSGDLRLSEQHLYGAKRLGMRSSNLLVATTNSHNGNQEDYSAEKRYELTNHLGNVLAVVSDQKKEDGTAQILSLTDYYPYGMEMDGRKYEKDGGYRYGFNGQEKTPELDESHTTALYWEYDGRLGRRWNMDPILKPMISPYCTFNNNPINRIDPNGDDDYFDSEGNFLTHTNTQYNYIRVMNDEELFNYQTKSDFDVNSVTTTISSFDYCDKSNERMLYKILEFYTKPLKLPTIRSTYNVRPSDADAVACTNAQNKTVSITLFEGHISKDCDISHKLVSSIIHEKVHTTQDLENYNGSMECEPILTQMQWEDNYLDKFPDNFHYNHEQYYLNSLNSYYKKFGSKAVETIKYWVNKYNEYIGYEVFDVNPSAPEECVSYLLQPVIVEGKQKHSNASE